MSHADRRHLLAPENLQELLDSARNAGTKGPAQWSTPTPIGRRLAEALPPRRPVLTDLTCGPGDLLLASANPTTELLLGLDLDKRSRRIPEAYSLHRITGDLTKVFSHLVAVDFRAECYVLNPPWDLHWEKARLRHPRAPELAPWLDLNDPRLGPDHLDSTVATWLLALDRAAGEDTEGLLIANRDTFHRLVADAGQAPYRRLLERAWAILEFPHWSARGLSCVAVYWRAGHRDGPRWWQQAAGPDPATWPLPDRALLADPRPWYVRRQGEPEWVAVAQEVAEQANHRPRWNLWLDHQGQIATYLSTYQALSEAVPKELAKRLHGLHGHTPLDLVQRRADRDALREAATRWAVAPWLEAAIRAALADYESERAPLIPLPEVQRLGFLDEHETLPCRQALAGHFQAGTRYRLESATVAVRRAGVRINAEGEEEAVEYSGAEMVLTLHGEAGPVRFVDARLLSPEVTPQDLDLTGARPLHELLAHFEIPEVPDLARLRPADLAHYQKTLTLLEEILTTL